MNKHIPGPWIVFEQKHKHPGIEARDGGSVVIWGRGDEWCGVRGNSQSQRLANARLIAAAPELLDALRTCLDVIDDQLPSGAADMAAEEARVFAHDAIAKATGSA